MLAVGSSAVMPPIPGLHEAQPWTNRELTSAREVPPALIILGGGVVGVEMAQAYSTLGSSVAIVEGAERLIVDEEPFAGEQLLAALLRRRGGSGRCRGSGGASRWRDCQRRRERRPACGRERDHGRGRLPSAHRRARPRHGRCGTGPGGLRRTTSCACLACGGCTRSAT